MIAWLAYCVLIASLVGLAAWVAEAALRALRRPTRWVWLAAMAASVLVPLLARLGVAAPRLLPVLPPLVGNSSAPGAGVVGGAGTSDGARGLFGLLGLTRGSTLAPDAVIGLLWVLGSVLVLLVLTFAMLRLRRARSDWRPGLLHGVRVLVSDDVGPAVAGWLRGVIVVPGWALELRRRLQRLMLVHEGEHLRAGDPMALLAGLLMLATTPWNPALWWQLRRLRQAVEADCDGRVLAARDDLRGYGRLLLEVGRRASPALPLATSLSEPHSFLERRIEIMTGRLRRSPSRRRALVLGAGALLVLGVAFCSGSPESMVKLRSKRAGSRVPAAQRDTVSMAPNAPSNLRVLRAPSSYDSAPDRMPNVLPGNPPLRSTNPLPPPPLTNRPPESTKQLESRPTFTPYTVAPDLINRQAVRKALEESYPPPLREAGIEGRALVWLFIDSHGKVVKTLIKTSSGHQALDRAAIRVAQAMVFAPAKNRDRPVAVWVALPIVFKR